MPSSQTVTMCEVNCASQDKTLEYNATAVKYNSLIFKMSVDLWMVDS